MLRSKPYMRAGKPETEEPVTSNIYANRVHRSTEKTISATGLRLKTVNKATGKTMELTSSEIVELVNSGLMSVNEARKLLGLTLLKNDVIMRPDNATRFSSHENAQAQFNDFGQPIPTP